LESRPLGIFRPSRSVIFRSAERSRQVKISKLRRAMYRSRMLAETWPETNHALDRLDLGYLTTTRKPWRCTEHETIRNARSFFGLSVSSHRMV
jgi:hypothetical protein